MGKLDSSIERDLTKTAVSMEIDLAEMFGLSFFPQDDALRQSIGQVIIDKIIANAKDSKFLSGSSNKGYSKAYAESNAGEVYGKKTGAKANLYASGDMLNSMDINLPSDSNKLVIEFLDSEESLKAHGHITGDKRGVGVKRDFFGLDHKDIQSIARDFEDAVLNAAALEMAGEQINQGEQDNLSFILGLLGGQG